jgi:ribosome-binding factor A
MSEGWAGVSREFPRSERIGAELLRELTRILSTEVRDPRLGEVTLQEVRVSRDLAHAKVYFTCFPMDEGGMVQERLLNGRLAGFLRRELARGSRLRTVPQLHFVHDVSVRHGEALSALIERAVGGDSAPVPDDSTAESAGTQEQVQ